jgi:hypothetical protein
MDSMGFQRRQHEGGVRIKELRCLRNTSRCSQSSNRQMHTCFTVRRMGLFGSFARDANSDNSDGSHRTNTRILGHISEPEFVSYFFTAQDYAGNSFRGYVDSGTG